MIGPTIVRRAISSPWTAAWLCVTACQPGSETALRPQVAAAAEPVTPPLAVDAGAPAAAEAEAPATPALARELPRFAGTGLDQDFVLGQLAQAEPVAFKALGSTSAVMHMRLAAPFNAAFKPVTSERPLGAAAEVAAYRLARCLGLDTVPPAITRELPAVQIRDALELDSKQRWPELRERTAVRDDGTMRGAAIYWISELADVGLEGRDGLLRASEWLALGADVPSYRRGLAASLSTMLAFDYLIGNFDRWSGGNARGDARSSRLYVRDHDLAFPMRMSEKLHRRLWSELQLAQRFSRRFYRALRALTPERLDAELANDPAGARGELLNARQIAGVFDRREALLSHIESLIALHGQAAVLAFE